MNHWGASVIDIPTSEKEESDLLVHMDGCAMLVEEKTKVDSVAWLGERRDVLARGEVHNTTTPLTRDNRLSGLIKKAASQLDSSSADRPHDFLLLWFTATGLQARPKFDQFIATLYGTTKIIEMGSNGFRTCYFFRNSDFFNCAQSLDGAIVAREENGKLSMKLCLNPLSPRVDDLRRSPIAARFPNALEDPIEAETRGAYVLDADIDRRDEPALLSYLQDKYRTAPLMPFDLGHMNIALHV
ncbi:hypothetical protein DZC73_25825 [Albitalea terrae]|uniref:Uncharacterized protein n=1 Tax=Piscinibacter terrae TaxID=2496871 RepID=A0A3N7HMK0_9BURK|nr:hypothetical protein DZC73_25825 [Albitalea terrae]